MISRRSLLRSGAFAGGAMLIGSAAACSSSPKKGGGSGAGKAQIWMWPSGFSDACMAHLASALPDVTVTQNVIGGDFKQKLTTTLSAKSGLPDVTGIKGEDIAFFRAKAEYFVDLNTLGFKDQASEFLDWKVKQGQSNDGKQIGFPMDIGPTVLFYRYDIFEEAGLPSEPDKIAERTHTWEDYFTLGEELIKAKPGYYLIRNAQTVFSMALAQQKFQFIDEDGTLVADDAHVHKCWDLAIDCLKRGIVAGIESNTPDIQAMVNEGTLPADFGASWHLEDLQGDAPDTSGKWHISACPGGAANIGGSFLAIPKGIEDEEKSYKVLSTIMNADGQTIEFVEKGHFPSALKSLDAPELSGEVEFLGGQKAIDVLKPAAESVVEQYTDPNNDTVGAPFFTELRKVEANNSDPDQAFADALEAAKKVAQQHGVKVK